MLPCWPLQSLYKNEGKLFFFFEIPALFYLVNEEIQCGKIQTITCSILNFSNRFPLNWLVCNIKRQEFFFFQISVILNLSLIFFQIKLLVVQAIVPIDGSILAQFTVCIDLSKNRKPI